MKYDNSVAFTRNKIYEKSPNNRTKKLSKDTVLIDDSGDDHTIGEEWLKYFKGTRSTGVVI